MPTNINLNDDLLAEVRTLGGFRTKRDAANAALLEFVERRKADAARKVCSQAFVDLGGTIDFDPDYDFRAARMSRTAP